MPHETKALGGLLGIGLTRLVLGGSALPGPITFREEALNPYRRMKSRALIDKIERLEHAVEEVDPE